MREGGGRNSHANIKDHTARCFFLRAFSGVFENWQESFFIKGQINMTATAIKKGRGGARPGAGRKPKSKTTVGKVMSALEVHQYMEALSVEPPPFVIDFEASEVWAICAPEVLSRDEAKPSDRVLLTAYCVAAGEVAAAMRIVESEGMIEKRPNGLMKHPAAAIMIEHLSVMAKLSDELGLTPLSRARLQKAQAEADSKSLIVARQKKHDREQANRERQIGKKAAKDRAGAC